MLLQQLLFKGCCSWCACGDSDSDSRESLRRLAAPPIGSSLLVIASTLYLFISKLVTAFKPLNFIAAISYASAASSSVPDTKYGEVNKFQMI